MAPTTLHKGILHQLTDISHKQYKRGTSHVLGMCQHCPGKELQHSLQNQLTNQQSWTLYLSRMWLLFAIWLYWSILLPIKPSFHCNPLRNSHFEELPEQHLNIELLCIPHLEHLAARPNWFCHSGANRSPCSLLDYWLVSKSDGTHSYIQRPYIYRHIICISWHGCTSIVVHIKSWYSTVPQNESSPIPWQLSVCLNPKIPHLRPGAKWHVGLEG